MRPLARRLRALTLARPGQPEALLFVAAVLVLHGTAMGRAASRFGDLVARGMVDLTVNAWSRRPIAPRLDTLRIPQPGVVNRLSFLYGG